MPRGFLSEGSGRSRDSEDGDSGFVTVDVILKRDHELSWGVCKPGEMRNEEMLWLPKSLVTLTGGEQPACKAKVRLPVWLATKKGLI